MSRSGISAGDRSRAAQQAQRVLRAVEMREHANRHGQVEAFANVERREGPDVTAHDRQAAVPRRLAEPCVGGDPRLGAPYQRR